MIRKLALILIISGLVLVLISQVPSQTADKIEWKTYQQALNLAKKDNKPVFIYFYSESCEYCRAMSANVFSDSHIAKIVNGNFVPVKVDVMKNTEIVKKFIPVFKEKKVYFVTPSYIILDPNGNVIGIENGYLEKTDFENFITNFITNVNK